MRHAQSAVLYRQTKPNGAQHVIGEEARQLMSRLDDEYERQREMVDYRIDCHCRGHAAEPFHRGLAQFLGHLVERGLRNVEAQRVEREAQLSLPPLSKIE